MKEEAFLAEITHDGGESVAAFVGASDVLTVAASVVHGGDVDVVGEIFAAVDFQRGWGVGFEECEVGAFELLHGRFCRESFEAWAQGGFGGNFLEAESIGKACCLILSEELDVIIVSPTLDEKSDLGGEDVGVGNAIGAGSCGFFEKFGEAAEFGDQLAGKTEAAMRIDFFVSQCEFSHKQPVG